MNDYFQLLREENQELRKQLAAAPLYVRDYVRCLEEKYEQARRLVRRMLRNRERPPAENRGFVRPRGHIRRESFRSSRSSHWRRLD